MKKVVVNVLCFVGGVALGMAVMFVRCMHEEDYIKEAEEKQ